MRTFLIAAISSIVVGLLSYTAGGYFTAKRLARDSSYATLLWLTSIDRDLKNGNIDRARQLALTATDGTLSLLSRLDGDPLPILMTVAGAFDLRKQNEITATRAKQHFLPISEKLSEDSKSFLEQVVEVEIPPSTCFTSDSPFQAFHVGDRFDDTGWNRLDGIGVIASPAQPARYRVHSIKHLIQETDVGLIIQCCLNLEPFHGSSSPVWTKKAEQTGAANPRPSGSSVTEAACAPSAPEASGDS